MNENQSSYSAVLGTIIASIRKEQGLEQADIAESLGVSQASYSRLESGKSALTVNQLFVVADKLGIASSNLIGQVESAIDSLRNGGVTIVSQGRANSAAAKQAKEPVGNFVAGAALGALLVGLLTRK